ncbi:MAG: PmoA family protein [Terriglobia bacterium]
MTCFLKTACLLAFAILPSGAFLAGVDQPVEFQPHPDSIEVLIGGKPFTTYYFGAHSPKPYLHPLRSAEGTFVTRGFPMRTDIPDESRDHPHHRALFFAHGDINGIDFWGESQPTKQEQTAKGMYYSSGELPKGRTVFRKLDVAKGGMLRATFDLVGPDGKAIGSETQQYTFHGDAPTRVIDCAFTLVADQGVPLKLGDTKEGTFAIRLVKALEAPNVKMLNSEGKVGEKEIWGKRAEWVDYSGVVAGEKLGIAIFDNPTNIKHPTYWHAREYGLFAVNPFGEHDFYNDPKRDGSVTIPAGQSLTLRYRVLIHHGEAAEAQVAEAYRRYAESK